MREKLILLVCIAVVAAFAAGKAVAYDPYLTNFNKEYSTAETPLDSCVICHVSPSKFGLNPYGKDYKGSNFKAIENTDSDGDGFTNIEEILN
jgi:hypothetical protein